MSRKINMFFANYISFAKYNLIAVTLLNSEMFLGALCSLLAFVIAHLRASHLILIVLAIRRKVSTSADGGNLSDPCRTNNGPYYIINYNNCFVELFFFKYRVSCIYNAWCGVSHHGCHRVRPGYFHVNPDFAFRCHVRKCIFHKKNWLSYLRIK